MHNKYFLNSIILSGFLSFSLGCQTGSSQEKMILGEWQAEWLDAETGEDLHNKCMNGKISFYKDGTAEIAAYGYKGCTLSNDTLINSIHWKIEDDMLQFMEADRDFGLPYNIKSLASKEAKFTLLDDIHLILKR